MMRIGLLAAALWGSGIPALGEDADFDHARAMLRQAISDDPTLGDEVTAQMDVEDWDGVRNTLEARNQDPSPATQRARPELAGTEWNDTWYEEPRDVIHGLNNTFDTGMDLLGWLENQEWRSFLSPVGKPGSRRTQDVNLMYVTVRGNGTKGAIVFSLGRSEPIRKYDEIAYDFITMGYSPLYIYTHRGQGESDRLIDNTNKPYVEKHRDFVHDFRAFTELVAEEMAAKVEDRDKPLFLSCHSMGAGVCVHYLIEEYEAQRLPRYNGVALVAPSLKMNTGSWTFGVAVALSDILVGLGQGRSDAPGNAQTFEVHHPNNFAGNRETHSFTRYKREKDKCMLWETVKFGVDQHPGLCNFGLSSRWVQQLFNQYLDDIEPFRRRENRKLEVPMLMQTAGGDTDGYVMNDYAADFCQNNMVTCNHSSYPDAMHWLFGAIDERRDRIVGEIDAFFMEHQSAPLTSASLPPGLRANDEGCNLDRQCMSRSCDAAFAWDIFGGQCKPKATFLTFSSSSIGLRNPVLVALAAVATAVIAPMVC